MPPTTPSHSQPTLHLCTIPPHLNPPPSSPPRQAYPRIKVITSEIDEKMEDLHVIPGGGSGGRWRLWCGKWMGGVERVGGRDGIAGDGGVFLCFGVLVSCCKPWLLPAWLLAGWVCMCTAPWGWSGALASLSCAARPCACFACALTPGSPLRPNCAHTGVGEFGDRYFCD